MVLTNDYYVIESKTNTKLAKELIGYLTEHGDGANIRDILDAYRGKYTSWEIKQTVMQLVSARIVRLTSDTTLKLQTS